MSEAGEICIANISPRERRRRLIGGAVQLAISLAVLTGLLVTGASRWWRLILYPLFGAAAAGYFQWRDKT